MSGSSLAAPAMMSQVMGGLGAPASGAAPAIGGIAPTASNQDPITQSWISALTRMSPEQLQQYSTLMGNTSLGQMAKRVLDQKRIIPNATPQAPSPGAPAPAAPPPAAAAPAAGGFGGIGAGSGMARGGVPHMAFGGNPMGIGVGAADPWWTRHAAFQGESGLLHSDVPGRTDHIAANPAADSFVIPADVVSGLGEGNTLAGARVLSMALRTGPYGIPQERFARHDTIPRPMRAPAQPPLESTGGPTKKVPIMAAGGEFVVPPEAVRAVGAGDTNHGHKVLRDFVMAARHRIVQEMRALRPPVKG